MTAERAPADELQEGGEIVITDSLHRRALTMAAERFPRFDLGDLHQEVDLTRAPGAEVPGQVRWLEPVRKYNFPVLRVVSPSDVYDDDERAKLLRRGDGLGFDWMARAFLPAHCMLPEVEVCILNFLPSLVSN